MTTSTVADSIAITLIIAITETQIEGFVGRDDGLADRGVGGPDEGEHGADAAGGSGNTELARGNEERDGLEDVCVMIRGALHRLLHAQGGVQSAGPAVPTCGNDAGAAAAPHRPLSPAH